MTGMTVLVYGGKGALGSAVVKHFCKAQSSVISIDLAANEEAQHNILLNTSQSLQAQYEHVNTELAKALSGSKLSAVFCVAGGWAGGNAASDDLLANTDLMITQSLWTSIISARLSANHLAENGLLVLTGSQPCLQGTPGMLGYGAAKAAVHQLTMGLGKEGSGLPAGATALAILPVTLDTPMNRKYMANADFSKWTPLETIAQQFQSWLEGTRPPSGSLVQVFTADGKTDFIV
eukprot:comp21255_c0_seq1/m.28970 comp21255_c0_seq1/g.28970  ORF comp21255_c0_seq1/g.28970 comp21255_c0_seq1/m.28970 type:complete len:234 (-) comp21255_c0_seq1:397-1098(-)